MQIFFTTRDPALVEYIQSRLNIEVADIIEEYNPFPIYAFENNNDIYDIVQEFYETHDRTNRKI